jgi:hypothetical protein
MNDDYETELEKLIKRVSKGNYKILGHTKPIF